MATIGERIRHARKNAGLTIEMLADLIDVTDRSVKRYESNQSVPDTNTLIHLACVLDLSTDYLLALSDNAQTSFLDKYRTNNIYYQRVVSNEPVETEDYFWVEFHPEKEAYPMSGQMYWAGVNKKGEDLYCLRPIIIENCCIFFDENMFPGKKSPLIINNKDDFYVFLTYGGDAFVTKSVCKEYLPHLLRPSTVK